jgi:predicted metal-dependent HD superfamily phosphohydrolase
MMAAEEFVLTVDERHTLEASWLALAVSHRAEMRSAAAWWRELFERHSEPHRRYHTLAHVRDVLLFVEGDASAAAAWFHDAIYDPAAKDNEEASAKLAVNALRELRFSVPTIDLVARMIRATAKHEANGLPQQALLFLDADLAILGSDRQRYGAYVNAVRDESLSLTDTAFRRGRRALLERLLLRPRIYFTDAMRDRFEAQARANAKWELEGS